MNQKSRLAVMASLAAVSNFASATNCSVVQSSFSSCTTASCRSSLMSTYPQCFAVSGTSSTSAQIAATSVQQITTISSAVSGRMLAMGFGGPKQKTASLGETTGLAAAGNVKPYNAWGNLGQADTSYSGDSNSGNGDKFTSSVTNTVLGLDYGLSSSTIVGLSVAFDRGSGSQGVNSVGMSTSGTMYAPYVGWQVSKTLALDASIGFGDGKFTTGANKADTTRSFIAANLSYSDWKDNLQLVGKAGYLIAEESYSNLTNVLNSASSSSLNQFRIGGEVGYWMNGAMPFVGLAYSTDERSGSNAAGLRDTSTLGKDAYTMSLGVNFFSLSSGITGGLLYTQEFGRANGKNDALSANISIRF